MEADFAWAPTPRHNRLRSVRLYFEGERLCDSGNTRLGISRLREAFHLAWELEKEAWPGWAQSAYAQLCSGRTPLSPRAPPMAAHDISELQPELLCWVGQWSDKAAVQQVAASLRNRNFVLLDHFIDAQRSQALRAAIAGAWDAGVLAPAPVAAPGNGLNGTRSERTRSDHIAWVDVGDADARWDPVRELVGDVDRLVGCRLFF